MKKIIAIALMAIMLIGCFAGCGSESKKLLVATNAEFEPFESLTADGEFVGFDIDLMNAIAEKMGYEVQYELNSNKRQNGNIVICNNENSCRLEEGSVNKVKFINIGGYLLPATGSSGMLILIIIGSLLLIGPIIYIGCINLKHLRKVS